MFREVADIQTAEMLELPTPKAIFKVESVPPSEEQENMVSELGERAEMVRKRVVPPNVDNMLNITSDGRKLALDQRILNPLLPDNENSKVNACVNNVYTLWKNSEEIKGTQLIFCDMSTPSKDSKYITEQMNDDTIEFTNVYDDIKRKLIKKGIPSEEIAFVHDAKNDQQRKELFAKTRQGIVRVLLGSTSKMGAGTNVQDRIVALHDLDCPWRPRDLEQRAGRGIRQGNMNKEVQVIRYVTEGTFDAYLFQMIEKKQQFISQIFTGKTPQRTMEEIDETVLNYAEIKAIATGNPKIMERCNLELEVNKLNVLKSSYLNQKYELQDNIIKNLPRKIAECEEVIHHFEKDIQTRNNYPLTEKEDFIGMVIEDKLYSDKSQAGTALLNAARKCTTLDPVKIGDYRSFEIYVYFNYLAQEYVLSLNNETEHKITLGSDKLGNITRMNNVLANMDKALEDKKIELSSFINELNTSKEELNKPFSKEEELQEKTKRLARLTMELKLEEKESVIVDEETPPDKHMEQDLNYER